MDDLLGRALFLVIGAFLGIVFRELLTRPKLRNTGSSGGGGAATGYSQALRFTNEPAFLGITLGQTVIFGRRIHNRIAIGLPISRNPATDCQPWLYDRKSGEAIGMLWWRKLEPGPPEYVRSVTLGAGESADLMLFARQEQDRNEYFPFEPSADPPLPFMVPPPDVRFRDTRTFTVRINFGYGGRQSAWFPVEVRRRLKGGLEIGRGQGMSSF